MSEENEPIGQNEENKEMQERESNSLKKDVAQKVAKEGAKKLAGKASIMGPLAHIIAIVAPILVIIIILGGIILFFLTMPGMVMEQLKAILRELGDYVAAFFGADTTEMIEDTDIYKTLDYLEEMGYDLKGYGFLTDYVTDIGAIDSKEYDSSAKVHLDDKMGVIRDENDKIVYAKSDFMFAYIASDNYVYTLKNDNIATQQEAENWFQKVGTAIVTAWYRIRNAVFGPVFDVLGITNTVGEKWGKGLIALYYEETPKNIGERGTFVNQGSLWNWDNIKINTKNKTLSIQRNEFLNTNNAIEFKLDGWSGRYGMPLEFLLSVHVATMMPDLAFDMIGNFPTTVNVYLHETSGEATAGYKKQDNTYVDYETLQSELSELKGKNWFSAAINWFDNWFVNSGEVEAAKQLGIDVGTGSGSCACTLSNDKASTDGFKIEESSGKWIFSEECKNEEGTVVHKKGDEYTGETIDVSIVSEACDYCKHKLKAMTDNLADQNDYDFDAYTPYIANVKDHWYRDVYFVDKVDGDVNPLAGFIENDYEYETVMKERWTLYETDSNGDFILYKINEDGSYGEKYNGTLEKAQGENIAVAKKPVMIKADQTTYEDLGWKNNGAGRWTAYDREDTESGYERLFTDEQIEEKIKDISDETKKKAYKEGLEKLYINMNMTENVVQTGDGLRTATNSTIKKIFLQNKYFKYDGTPEKAEIITEFRNKLGDGEKNKYGALTKDELKKEVTVDGKTYKASDLSSKVALNQDSLNAFNMLENTHTLDADYIYRDFKELIVELGYFKKEELTDETPRLLQWLVPAIGSGGYPNRTIDKNENEFGTMVHSKGDIDANEKNTLKEIIEKMNAEEPTKGNAPEPNKSQVQQKSTLSSNNSNINLQNVKGTGASFVLERIEESGEGYVSVVQSGNVKYIHRYQGGEDYSTKHFLWDGRDNTVGDAACGLFACFNVLTGYGYEFDPYKDLPGFNWGATMQAVKDLMEEKGVTGQFIDYTDTATLDQALNEGRPAILLFQANATDKQGVLWTTQGHFVALVGKDAEGNILTLDSAAQGNMKKHDYPGTVEDMQVAFQTNPIWIADEPPTGMKKGEGDSYEGYQGNEAVVSPVTGILLDYGTYDDDDKSSITGEKYRQNVDLKYIKQTEDNTQPDPNTNGGNNDPQVNPNYDPEKPDKVGYAKILVLDGENYKKLEAKATNPWQNDSLVNMKSKTDEEGNKVSTVNYKESEGEWILDKESRLGDKDDNKDTEDPWTEIAKTVYGYKEFAESYEMAGISGHIVYIDGFKCEKPDEEFTEEQLENKIPNKDKQSEQEITLESFKKVTSSDLQGTDLPDVDKIMPTLYEKDETYKMASKKATEKAQAEAEVKNQASSTLYLESEDLIFIKEGTLLGRTITDYELITEYRKDDYTKYRKDNSNNNNNNNSPTQPTTTNNNSKGNENEDSVIGNYLRIILRDTDDTVIENVEDYMKLDDDGEEEQEIDDDVFIKYLDHYENGAVYEYLFGDASYSDYVKKYITEDKKYFICFKDGVNGNDDRNFGFGILHWLGGSYQSVENYSKVGITINDGSYIEVGVSKCPVDKVLEVQKMIIEGKRELVISQIGQGNYDKLTKQQQDCLVDIAYQGCSSWGELKSLLDSGATPEQVVNSWSRLTSTQWNNQERANARKKLWLEGIYTDSSGNEIK